MFEGLMF